MNKNTFSCSIHNLKLIPPTPNKIDNKFIITSMSPFNYDTKPEYYYTNKKKMKMFPSFLKGFTPNNRYNYYTIISNTDLDKKEKSNCVFPKISLSTGKLRYNKTNNSEMNDFLISSIYKKLKLSQNTKFIKRENLFFMKEKKSQIQNIHKNLMKRNEFNILTRLNNELNNKNIKNDEEEKNKFNSLTLTEYNKESFDNEYDNICKNKLKEKKLIENEINILGKDLSWIKNFKKNNGQDDSVKKLNKEINKENKEKKKENNISNNILLNRMKENDPVLEINQTSNFPIIADDKKLVSNLWKKDMMKYCKYIFDSHKPTDKKLLKDLLDVYD